MDSQGIKGPADSRPRSQAVWWVIAVSLAVIAFAMILRSGQPLLPPSLAQPMSRAGAGGIFAFSGQLSPNTHGVFMVDVDTMTIWCYEYLSGPRELRLVAGRSWMYDRYLENFNCQGPPPEAVQKLIDQERQNKLRGFSNKAP